MYALDLIITRGDDASRHEECTEIDRFRLGQFVRKGKKIGSQGLHVGTAILQVI